MEEEIKKYGYGWGGIVIEVSIDFSPIFGRSIWVTTDDGMAFIVKNGDIFSWNDGPWGKRGQIRLEDYQNVQKI